MTDRESKIGDVIRVSTGEEYVIRNAHERWIAAKNVASGRWVIVDTKPAAEPGPAADTATTREGE